MRFRSGLFITIASLSACLNSAWADIEWSGVYRVEAYNIKNSQLDSRNKSKDYALHHLTLRPKIVAGDGFTIFGQFELLNQKGYANSQLGSYFGSGPHQDPTAASTGADDSNVLTRNQAAGSIRVSNLYLTYSHEYGQLIVGRVPLQFGLGVTYSAGRNIFDHWYSTDDLVGYKFIFGNMWVLPMVGRASEGFAQKSDDLKDYMVQFQYENPETDLEIGVFYQWRDGGNQASDGPVSTEDHGLFGGKDGKASGKVTVRTANIYVAKDTPRYRIGFEGSYQTGETGVVTGNGLGDNVTMAGFALAAEFDYRPRETKWNFGLRAGVASGDDPDTDAKYEGYAFNRNYDVAMLMFNHPLGKYDVLRSGPYRGNVYEPQATADGASRVNAAPDVEVIDNALYLAPKAKYNFNEHWGIDGTLVAAWVAQNPWVGSDPGKGLGYEVDVSLTYSPRKGVMWINQAGLLLPGNAWTGNPDTTQDGYQNKASYGLATRAAISF